MGERTSTNQRGRVADSAVVVIFGASGDLTKRKLMPALYNLHVHGLLPREIAVVGQARTAGDDTAFRTRMTDALRERMPAFDHAVWDAMCPHLFYVSGGYDDPAMYEALAATIAAAAAAVGAKPNVVFYMATPPEVFATIATHLGRAGLVKAGDDPAAWTRIVVEKPFGRDLESARALNQTLRTVFDETQIYRIDHYLGKETVQNILMFRFLNGIFEPVWNRRYVDHVQIIAAETLGVEGRGGYYETSGALRDMLQNHLLQLLTLVAMEPPISLEAEDLRNEKVKVLHAIRRFREDEVLQSAIRGQYGPGTVDGRAVPGYREEANVAPDSRTDTFVAMRLFVENWRWADVPFYLRTGKRLARQDTEVVIQFRRAPLTLLPDECGQQPNRLTLHIQPDERITLSFQAKRPGPVLRLAPVQLEFAYRDLDGRVEGTGYETLLYDCLIGDPMPFHRADMVEEAWRVVTPVLDIWHALPPREFPNYAAGTWGPRAAEDLLTRDGRAWADPA
jgi:glucose-6-phosphate 1-dehydrogenase